MDFEQTKQIIVDEIDCDYNSRGYVSIDEVLELANKHDLKLDEIDRLTEFLLSRNYIIKNDQSSANDEDIQNDYSRTDYNELYKRIENIEPSLSYYLNILRRIPPPQTNEAVSIFFQAKEGNTYARSRLVSMYLRVALCAKIVVA